MDFSGTLRNEGRLPTVPRYVDTQILRYGKRGAKRLCSSLAMRPVLPSGAP